MFCVLCNPGDQMYSLKIGRNQMYYSLEKFDFFAHSLELPLKTGGLTPRQSQPRSCFLYSLQILVYSL